MSQLPPATAEPGRPSASPYRGLTPYTEDDYDYFFGRERETNAISANLEVARFTLFYGPSGVGKTSVLRAGVLYQLQQRAAANAADGRPEIIPVYFNRWQQEPVQGLAQAVAAAAQPYLPDPATIPPDGPPDGPLLAQLQGWSEATGSDLLLILDQFEEYFLYQSQASESDPASFGVQLVQIANHTSLRVNLLISLREDALARLDYFKGRIPFLLDNRLSIGHLNRSAGQQAVEAPLAQYNREHGTAYTIERQLVEAVLDQVGSGTITLGRQGSGRRRPEGTELAAQDGDIIEAPYLQLVLTRLWEEERAQHSRQLRLSTLDELGGAAAIVGNYLDLTLDALPTTEQSLAAHYLDQQTSNDKSVPDQDTTPKQPVAPASGYSSSVYIETGGGAYVAGHITVSGGVFAGRDIVHGFTSDEVANLIEELRTTFQPKPFDGRCPYVGLDAFQEEDADRFFGRERLVADLVRRVAESRHIVIVGPSGSGKSSLVRAGLFPKLKSGALSYSEYWKYASLRPGRTPLEALGQATERLTDNYQDQEFIRIQGRTNPAILHQRLETALGDNDRRRAVILIDDSSEKRVTGMVKTREKIAGGVK